VRRLFSELDVVARALETASTLDVSATPSGGGSLGLFGGGGSLAGCLDEFGSGPC
jgi:hypothetical protein